MSQSEGDRGRGTTQTRDASATELIVKTSARRAQPAQVIVVILLVVALGIGALIWQRSRQIPVITDTFIGKRLPVQVGGWQLNLATVPTITSPLYNGYARENRRIIVNAVGGQKGAVEQAISKAPEGHIVGRSYCTDAADFRRCYLKASDGYLEFFSNDSDLATVAEVTNLMADHFD